MTPIGSVEHPFSGILYGNNHSISDVRMSSSNGATIAFFGAVSGTVVELGLGNLNMSSNGYAAGLVGTLSGFISGCGVGGTITSGLGGNGYNTGTGNVLAVTVLNTATIYNSTEGGTFNGNKILATLNFGPMLPTPYSCKSGTCTVVSYVCSGPTLAIDCVPGS